MKWNIEWVDLKNIEQMAAECWRMSERQLLKYCKELWEKRELVFAGELGREFFRLMCDSVDNGTALDWSKLQKDVRLMLEMIQDGQGEDEIYWKNKYQELAVQYSSHFYTVFGRSFTEHLADKLELELSENQKMIRRDIHIIQGICDACNWEDEAAVQKALMILRKKERNSFSSWLGEGFVELLEEKYGKKEEMILEEPLLEPEPEPEKHGFFHRKQKTAFKTKLMSMVLGCIFISSLSFYLYIRIQGEWHLSGGTADKTNADSDINRNNMAADSEYEERQIGDALMDRDIGVENLQSTGNMNHTDADLEVFAAQGESDGQNDVSGSQNENDVSGSQNEDAAAGSQNESDAENENDVSGSQNENAAAGSQNENGISAEASDSKPKVLEQYRTFYKKYPDLFGWLKIPGTEIDHPIMQSDDEKRGEKYYYLHRDYTGKKAEEGSLFVESKSSSYPQDDNTVIYGHNMSNGHNFGILEKYKDPDFYESHQTIQYDTIYETGDYQVAAVLMSRVLYQEEKGFRYYRFYNYSTDSEFKECTDFINESRLYDTGVELDYGDKLLMLSTCEYSHENGRLVIVAKRIEQ